MQCSSDNPYQTDMCLLLRAHGEHFWLSSQVLPVLRQLERERAGAGALSEDERAAALSYLEVLWIDARCRASATDAALGELLMASGGGCAGGFVAEARRYHAAVCALRMSTRARVRRAIDAPHDGYAHEAAAL
jgi:hypothetical protein